MSRFDHPGSTQLHAEQILELEFEYARETASLAQTDRTVIVNLYLLLVGAVGSLMLAVFSFVPVEQFDVSDQALSGLFFVLGLLGVLTLFKLIRLRQAWYESVRAMNAIKAYYLAAIPELDAALTWKPSTIPPLGKAWTITFILSAMVILLSSVSLTAALHFMEIRSGQQQLVLDGIGFIVVVGFQFLFYFFELRSPETGNKKGDESE